MRKIFPFFLLISISLILIFYNFTVVPKNLSFDEVEFGRLALSLNGKPYIPYSILATGHSTLYFYIILFSFKIFGVTNFALRLPSALFGVLNVLLFYLITFNVQRLTFNVKDENIGQKKINPIIIPFICSFIFLSMRWYFNFARFAFEATFLLFLELTSIYLLINAKMSVFFATWEVRTPSASQGGARPPEQKNMTSSIYFMFSGIFTGLAFNSYTPGRIFFLLPLSFLLIKTIKQYSHITIKPLLLFLIPFLVTIAPLSIYFMTHQDTRINQLSYISNNRLSVKKKLEYFGQNILKTAGMFNFKGDLNGKQNYPGKPALNPLLGILFIVGLLLTIKQWNNVYNKFFIAYFLISVFPALLTYPWENPHMLRTFTAIVPVVYFIGMAIHYLLKRFKYSSTMIIMFILILLSSGYELRTYFVYQNQVFPHAFEMKGELKQWIK